MTGLSPIPESLNATSGRVIAAALEVHRHLGPGFLESVYESALCVEMESVGLSFVRQPIIEVQYKGPAVGEGRMDLLVGGHLVVELKAVDQLTQLHNAQLLSYLKATGHRVGLLINFNTPQLRQRIRRLVL